jgi:mono/diheme cytochrome c family protein
VNYATLSLHRMKTLSPRTLLLRKLLFAGLLALIVISVGLALFRKTSFITPASEKERKNPVPATPENLAAAKQRYSEFCTNCHGDTGKGDGSEALRYDPKPADFTDTPHMSTVTDGALFYQISQGRKPMPSFKRRMTEDQRWQLVLLIRSFAPPAAKQPDAPAASPSK